MVGLDGVCFSPLSIKVRYKILYPRLRERKVVDPKLDNLWKHDGGKKVIITMPKVCRVWEFY
jgi:hypothetical protein